MIKVNNSLKKMFGSDRSLFIASILLLYCHSIGLGSFEVFFPNQINFISYTVTFLILSMVIGLVVVGVIAYITSFILPNSVKKWLCYLALGGSLLAYGERLMSTTGSNAQNMVFQLASISPQRIVLSMLFMFLILELTRFALKKNLSRKLLIISFFLLLINSLAVGWDAYKSGVDLKIRPVLDKKVRFEMSEKQNVIVFILDTFQSDAFAEIVDTNHEIATVFKDFTYYPDTVGCHRETYPSIPCYLSGKQYDNSVDYQTYIEKVYDDESLPAQLKKRGFKTHVYESPLGIPYDESLIDSIKPTILAKDKLYDLTVNVITGLYRTSPAFIKALYDPMDIVERADIVFHNQFYLNDYGFDLIAQENFADVRYTLKFLNNLDKNNTQPVFSFYHFNGVHLPLTMGQGFKKTAMSQVRDNYITVATNNLLLMDLMLSRLKELDIYDNSLIVIAGDHGAYFEIGINTTVSAVDHMQIPHQNDPSRKFPNHTSAGLPLLLIKPAEVNQETLRINGNSISMIDFSAIVLSVLDNQDDSEIPVREIRSYMASIEGSVPTFTHRPKMEEFEIIGPSWFESSWRNTGRAFERENWLERD